VTETLCGYEFTDRCLIAIPNDKDPCEVTQEVARRWRGDGTPDGDKFWHDSILVEAEVVCPLARNRFDVLRKYLSNVTPDPIGAEPSVESPLPNKRQAAEQKEDYHG
jgi:hypothetical protein